jgi:hypothetical protein
MDAASSTQRGCYVAFASTSYRLHVSKDVSKGKHFGGMRFDGNETLRSIQHPHTANDRRPHRKDPTNLSVWLTRQNLGLKKLATYRFI